MRSKAFSGIIFMAFCLLFSYQFLIFAQQPETKFPAELQELLQGKTSDVSLATSQLKETELPAALAVIELLKFKALHREIPVNVDQINDFEAIIKSRLKNSSVVSFSRTETCRKKVEATEIEVAGQKIAIPEYYIAKIGLAITGVIPTGEAGTIFPDIQINISSLSPLTKYSLNIDGKPIPNNKINVFKDSDELGLIFRPDLDSKNILSIGTHTEEISIVNEANEQVKKQWAFTVGLHDTSTPPLPDHLKKIRYATDPGNDIYDNSNNRIWDRTDTQPLVVACNSTITLIPEFEGQKKLKVRDGVTFQWFDSDGLLALSGNTDLDDEIYFPTPTVIDKHTLKLGFAIVDETIEIPETYTVKKIIEKSTTVMGTADLVYYMKCVKDSVSGLKGKRSSTPDKEMVDTFYDWWWNPENNKLQYYVPKQASSNIHEVILSQPQGGMCQALGNYFYKCLESQGVEGLKRVGFNLCDTNSPSSKLRKIYTKSPMPYQPEYWGAVVYKHPGLGRNKETGWGLAYPNPKSPSIYGRSKIYRYTGDDLLPPVATLSVVIDYTLGNVENVESDQCYCFYAPDGHALVYYTDKGTGNSYLYDPTFGKGKFGALSVRKPILEIQSQFPLKKLGGNAYEFPRLWNYLSSSINSMKGFTFFKSAEFTSGLSVFEVPFDKINYLEVKFENYFSYPEKGAKP